MQKKSVFGWRYIPDSIVSPMYNVTNLEQASPSVSKVEVY